MDASEQFNALLIGLEEARSQVDEMFSEVESVFGESGPFIHRRREQMAVMAGILIDALLQDTDGNYTDVTNALVTIYLLGFVDGKKKGSEVGRNAG